MSYFYDERDELAYFKYKNKKLIKNTIELKYQNTEELKKNIEYPVCLMPYNSLFVINDTYYQFKYYNNTLEMVFANEYELKTQKKRKEILFKPNLYAKRIFDTQIS